MGVMGSKVGNWRSRVMLLVLVVLVGCGKNPPAGRGGGGGGTRATAQQRAELLVGTMDTLFRLEAYEFGQAEELVMSRLNQWLRGQDFKTPWQREPRLDESAEADAIDSRGDVAGGREYFSTSTISRFCARRSGCTASPSTCRPKWFAAKTKEKAPDDGHPTPLVRQDPFLGFVSPDDPEELRLAMHLFDWTIKNVQLEEDAWPETTNYKLPAKLAHALRNGAVRPRHGQRSRWAFILLARQQGLDVVMLASGRLRQYGRTEAVAAGARASAWRGGRSGG